MSSVTLYASAVAAWLALAALAAPTHDTLSVDLSEVMDKSVCPIEVYIDTDDNRIPRRIKMLKCAKTPNPMCKRQGLTHACCRRHHHNFSTQCVEVTDHVLVQYRGSDDLKKLPVAVGCSCMIREGTPALEGT